MAALRLSGPEWEQQEHLLKVRWGNRCEAGIVGVCLADRLGYMDHLTRDQVEIQHRKARGAGGTSLDDTHVLSNLLWLCRCCHRWVEQRIAVESELRTGRPAEAERRGLWIRHAYRDGVPVPASEVPLVLPSGRRVLLHPTEPFYLPHPDPMDMETLLAGRVTPS